MILATRYSHADHLQIVALARSGKLISRSFNVAVEGVVMQGMKKADNIDGPPGAGGGGPRAGDIEMVGRGRATSMDDYWEDWDYISPEWQQEIAREAAQAAARQAADAAARARGSFEYLGSTKGSWSGSVGSSQGRGSFLSDSTVSQPAGVAGAADVKKVLIGSHAFGCICRIAEQITLYNYYDEHCRNAENVSLPSSPPSPKPFSDCCKSTDLSVFSVDSLMVTAWNYSPLWLA